MQRMPTEPLALEDEMIPTPESEPDPSVRETFLDVPPPQAPSTELPAAVEPEPASEEDQPHGQAGDYRAEPIDVEDAPAFVEDHETAAAVLPEDLFELAHPPVPDNRDAQIKAMLEAIIYIADEPLSASQIAAALGEPLPEVHRLLDELVAEFAKPEHGLTIREVAGGFKMGTKPEHHEAIRSFVRNLKPPLKLSLAALETLAVIAYKQPITAPEIMEIRGVQGAGVMKTLIDRKLVTTAGRKNVVGKPILYKTTKDFLVQFGLKDLAELPTLKEFEELRRLALSEPEEVPQPEAAQSSETEPAAASHE